MSDALDRRLDAIATQPFRARFRLRGNERTIVNLKGLATIRKHASDLIAKRLAPAQPTNDGKQTPYKGHPVFVAQHATATCCRSCLERWHKIPKNEPLDATEHAYVVDVIERWLSRELAT